MIKCKTACMITPMSVLDLDAVLNIEKQVFKAPWSRRSFETELEKDYALCLTAKKEGEVAGYAIAWNIVDEIHIANIAVHPIHQRQNIAHMLLNEILKVSGQCKKAVLEVRRSNFPARNLYLSMGFAETGLRQNYYEEDGEDAVLMSKDITI